MVRATEKKPAERVNHLEREGKSSIPESGVDHVNTYPVRKAAM